MAQLNFLVCFDDKKYIIECDQPRELFEKVKKKLNLTKNFTLKLYNETFREYVELDDNEVELKALKNYSKLKVEFTKSESDGFNFEKDYLLVEKQVETNISNSYFYNQHIKSFLHVLKRIANKITQDDGMNDQKKHVGVYCNICRIGNFILDRYRCLVCPDYDLCGECFEKRLINGDHKINHPMVRFSNPNEIFGEEINDTELTLDAMIKRFETNEKLHFKCNGSICSSKPESNIKGISFKCDECLNFDLCLECYKLDTKDTETHKPSLHPLLVVQAFKNLNSDNVEPIELLGGGAFGCVYKAKLLPKGNICALKKIEYDLIRMALGINIKELMKSFMREIVAYNELNSQNILKLYGSFIEKKEDKIKLFLVMEYMEHGSLAKVIKEHVTEASGEKKLSFSKRLVMASNIANGMRRMHEKNFIHRDIRPDNIMVDANFNAKIGDMGISKLIDPNTINNQYNNQNTLIGCLPYMPREFYSGKYNQKLDVFTFGLTLFELFTGKKHICEINRIKLPGKCPVFSRLILSCLDDDPNKRPTSEYIDELLTLYCISVNFLNKIKNIQDQDATRQEVSDKDFIDLCNYIEQQLNSNSMTLNSIQYDELMRQNNSEDICSIL